MAGNGEDSVDMTLKKLFQKITGTYVKKEKDNDHPAPAPPTAVPDFSQLDLDAEDDSMPAGPHPEENLDMPKSDPEHGAGDAKLEQKIADMRLGDPLSYNMGHPARGLFLLFNVIGSGDLKRQGTNVDADRMVATFKRMGFVENRVDNPTRDDMIGILKTVAGFDHTLVDCVAVAILCHGEFATYERSDKKHTIADRLMSSSGWVFLKELTEPLREKNCHDSLRGKPKLFFIQSCRGSKLEGTARYHDPNELVFLSTPTSSRPGQSGVDVADDNEAIVQGGENQAEQAQPAAGKEVKVQTTETGEEAIAQPEEEKEATVQPEEEKEATVQPEEEKEATVQPEEEKEAIAQPEEEKEATVQPEEEKEATVQPEEEKEAIAQPEEEKEAIAQPEEEKEAIAQSEEEKEAIAQPEEEKEAIAQPEEEKEAIAQPEEEKEAIVKPKEEKEVIAQSEESPDDVVDKVGSGDRQDCSLPEDMPIYKDFLVAWSTAPGYFSFRNDSTGSVFVQTLCRYLEQYHAQEDLLTILTRCNSDIAHQFQSNTPFKPYLHKSKQMPWFFSRLTKELVFTPKPAAGGGDGQ